MDRRSFIKNSCFGCIALGAGITAASLASCSTIPLVKTSVENKKIALPLIHFTEENKTVLVRPNNLDYDILVVKNADGSYRAIYMQCTHNQFALSSNKSKIYCTSHGAEFDFEGNVKKGPAEKKLKLFPTIVSDTEILIQC